MPSPRLDSLLQEYTFTEEELKQAKLLNSLQVMYFNTRYALYFKQKASTMIPTDEIGDREFLLTMGKLEGKLELIQEIFDDCKEAQRDLATASNTQQNSQAPAGDGMVASVMEIHAIEQANQVAAGMVTPVQQT